MDQLPACEVGIYAWIRLPDDQYGSMNGTVSTKRISSELQCNSDETFKIRDDVIMWNVISHNAIESVDG